MKIKSFLGGFDKNFCYLVWCEKTKIAAIIDPSTEINPIAEYIEKEKLILSKLLITHTHHDHIAYLNDFLDLYTNLIVYCFHKPINMKNDYIGLIDNEIITIGETFFTTIYTPGHFIDSICYWNKEQKLLFTGDTLFVGRTGRTVSNTSNIEQLYSSVYNRLLKLPYNTMIYPGHHYGYKPNISIKNNIKLFDFFQCKSLSEFKKIMKKFEKNR
jgi:glyoxylase-like metal-dependent hydrolase (beta-lactamase superfamily II)